MHYHANMCSLNLHFSVAFDSAIAYSQTFRRGEGGMEHKLGHPPQAWFLYWFGHLILYTFPSSSVCLCGMAVYVLMW